MERYVLRLNRRRLAKAVAICATLVLGFSAIVSAQEKVQEVPHKILKREGAPAEAKYIGPQPFDILHYTLDLSFAMKTEDMGGTVGITMVLKAPADTVVLNEVALNLDAIRVDGVGKSFTTDSTREAFTIHLGAARNAGDTLHISIDYHRVPGLARKGRPGYYYFVPETAAGLPDTVGYTMSEPSDARFWMPCFDDPSEKASAEINATVPSGFVAASNGKLLGVTQNGNGTVTWRWVENHQIAPYLMCVTISKWAVYTYPFVRAVNDTVPVQYYVFRTDSVVNYLPRVAEMIGAFGKVYGDYPWDKYGMSGVVPFGFGGMEHQSMTTLNRFVETDDAVVSHELAHQWWGDLVTCGTWKDIWLNESFATYSEAIWAEHLGGFGALKSTMLGLQNFNAGSWRGAVYDPEGQGYFIFSDLVYGKGAWVLHTLRGVLGDSLFFRTLRAYRDKFSQGNAVTDDLRAVADSMAGTSMAWFFDQWIYKPGWPIYSYGYTWAANTLSLQINQQQSAPGPTYIMPVQIRVYHGTADTTITVRDSLVKQTFAIPLAYSPDSVKFDPDNWILKQLSSTAVSVEETPRPLAFSLEQNYPNPFNPVTTIKYTVGVAGGGWQVAERTGAGSRGPGASKTRLAVYDVLGRQVATLVNENKAPGNYEVKFDGSRLASGVYFYRLTSGNFSQTQTMMIVK